MAALVVEALCAGYEGIPAVRDVSFTCEPGEVLSILGPNGAGKTTTLLAIAGPLRPLSGSVQMFGTDLTGRPTHAIARHGLILVPDDRGVFPTLTVAEHLDLARRSAPARRSGVQPVDRKEVLGRFPALEPLLNRQCGLLSGGEQQMLAIAKALMMAPSVLLVDELSLGLAPMIVQALIPTLSQLARDSGMALVLVEQHFELARALSTNPLVMNHGNVVASGPAAAWLADPSTLEAAYFGEQ
jgi:branched-chain amino acid transport system ATP-binding protein